MRTSMQIKLELYFELIYKENKIEMASEKIYYNNHWFSCVRFLVNIKIE